MSPSTCLLSRILMRITALLLLPLVLVLSPGIFANEATSVAADSSDQPDLKREQKFFDIYTNFNQEPTSAESWSGALSGKAQGYVIQTGDTLWGVSETLFGDPQFWPKIWSLNNELIENPHEIRPNQEVQFVPGTMGEAPTLAVTEAGASGVESAPEPTKDLDSSGLPTPGKKHPPLSGIPNSLPAWGYRKDRRQEILMEVKKLNRNFISANEALSYFVADQETQAAGKITETEMNQSSAAEFQYVFVKFSEAPAQKTFLVVKDTGTVKDPLSGNKGTVVQVQGQIEVLEAVNAEDFLYRAIVKKVLGPIEVGAQLAPGEIPVYSTRDEGSGGFAKAKIIGGQYSFNRQNFGPSNVVYLGGEGLVLGQTYPIFKIQKIRNEATDSVENPREIGKVKIVKLMQNFATGVILSATDEVRIGDSTDPQIK